MTTEKRRAYRGFTYDACHGCGSTEMHRKDSLCPDCAKKLQKFEDIQTEATLRGEEGARPFFMKERAYAMPYFHHMSSEDCRDMQEAFWELGQILSLPTDLTPPSLRHPTDEERQAVHVWPIGQRDFDWQCVRLMDSATAKALRRLCTLVLAGLRTAHQTGVAEGKNLLLSLADGSLTNDEFNSRAARLTKDNA